MKCSFVALQLAESIRLLLHYTGTEFKDERYECGDGKAINICRILVFFACKFMEWRYGEL